MTSVSIAIVHYETPELLELCLTSIERSMAAEAFEIIVVDNASTGFNSEPLLLSHPGVQLITNPENVGFARASNQALALATGDYLLLLNPDTIVEPSAISVVLDVLEKDPTIGCATARILLPDGRLDLACRRSFPTPEVSFYRMTMLSRLFPTSRRFGRYNLTYLSVDEPADIDAPCGAFMMVPRAVADRVGLLDERYFMYGEDLDWAYRIKAGGWRVRYVPAAIVHHSKRASSRQHRGRAIRWFHDAMRLFYRSHYEPKHPWIVNRIVLGAISIRERIELTAVALAGRSGPTAV